MNSTAEKLEVLWDDLNLDYEGENKYASFFSSNGNLHTYYPSFCERHQCVMKHVHWLSLSNLSSF